MINKFLTSLLETIGRVLIMACTFGIPLLMISLPLMHMFGYYNGKNLNLLGYIIFGVMIFIDNIIDTFIYRFKNKDSII